MQTPPEGVLHLHNYIELCLSALSKPISPRFTVSPHLVLPRRTDAMERPAISEPTGRYSDSGAQSGHRGPLLRHVHFNDVPRRAGRANVVILSPVRGRSILCEMTRSRPTSLPQISGAER